MLLRLLPVPTPEQPSPPTILFTLPLPTHPYTSRSLPLPANLHAHRSVCLQEDIDCPNVLLGEKASWIGGIIDEVAFSLPSQVVTVRYIDDTVHTLDLTPACTTQLRAVIQQVQLSFQPAPVSEPPSPSTSCSSASSIASSSSGARRSPSSLLLSFLSPLLSSPQQQQQATTYSPAPVPQPPARLHRRQARSLLVDAYRRHILPVLKEALPSAYLPWVIASESARRMMDFESIRGEIESTLSSAGVNMSFQTPMKRSHSASTSANSTHSGDLSDSDSEEGSPVTPATSIFSPSPSECSSPRMQFRPKSVNPSAYLLTLPPAVTVPHSHRTTYSSLLARLALLVNRSSSIKKLNARYEREEGKRRWLETLERGRAGDRALRKAFSNGEKSPNVKLTAEPTKRSGLWRSWTMDDQMRAEAKECSKDLMHPAMMESIDEVETSEDERDDDSIEAENDVASVSRMPVPVSVPRIYIPASDADNIFTDPTTEETATKMVREKIIHVVARPPLERSGTTTPWGTEAFEDADVPDLLSDTDSEPSTPVKTSSHASLPSPELFTPPRYEDIAMSSKDALAGSPLCRSKSRLEVVEVKMEGSTGLELDGLEGLITPRPRIKELDIDAGMEIEEVETVGGVAIVRA